MKTLKDVTSIIDGLYLVYMDGNKLFYGFGGEDTPTEYSKHTVSRIYPFDDSIIIEITNK